MTDYSEKTMNDLERIQNEIITILVLIVTLAFTSCNLTSESLEDKSLAERLPLTEANN
ncbi:MAG: hypothetical protein QNJ41_26840 [Xenococcaceae cyanobacterium MO_188.B32]|nr:hypothetical protein [Xenococcaceae cyanobacterium MO_188.B32]